MNRMSVSLRFSLVRRTRKTCQIPPRIILRNTSEFVRNHCEARDKQKSISNHFLKREINRLFYKDYETKKKQNLVSDHFTKQKEIKFFCYESHYETNCQNFEGTFSDSTTFRIVILSVSFASFVKIHHFAWYHFVSLCNNNNNAKHEDLFK
jgi:hypothetical protein